MADIRVTQEQVRHLEGDELVTFCRDVAGEINRLQALLAVASNQVWEASEGHSGQDTLTKRYGCRSSVELVQRMTGEPSSVVASRLKLGRQVVDRQSLVGEQLPALQEHVAAGLQSGLLNMNAAVHISKVLVKNARADAEDLEMAQRCLVQAATGLDFQTGDEPGIPLHADEVRRLCVAWDAGLDPDGVAPSEEERDHKRFLNIGPIRDGMARINGLIKAEVAAMFTTIMDTVNNPRVDATHLPHLDEESDGEGQEGRSEDGGGANGCKGADGGDGVEDCDGKQKSQKRGQPGEAPNCDGEFCTCLSNGDECGCGKAVGQDVEVGLDPTDERTWAQRRHDVFAMALEVTLSDTDLPILQGASATIVVEINEDSVIGDNQDGTGVGWLVDHEGASTAISSSAVHRMSCNGNVQAVVRNSLGRIVGLGSQQRLFTPTQRRSIALRDRGCVIPGCNVPAAWCEVHHVQPHSEGGPTHTDNGVILCRYHHATIDSSGWVITMHAGIPYVKPPELLMRLHSHGVGSGWVNYAMYAQTRRIQETLKRQKHRRKRWRTEKPPEWGAYS